MKQKTIFLLLALLYFSSLAPIVKAQNLAAYVDYKNALQVFNDGVKIQLDHRKPKEVKVGYTNVVYINSLNELWTYHNGKQYKLLDWTSKYEVTDNLITYGTSGFLNVFENGVAQLLCSQGHPHSVGDSIIAFKDIQSNSFNVYYDQKVHQLETDLLNSTLYWRLSENLVAYVNPQNYFLVFYHGKINEIMYTEDRIDFQVGLNIVAYIDPTLETFHMFFKGEIIELEEYPPASYKCGDNMVAYINMEGEFIQVYNNEKFEINSYSPESYTVIDDMVVYEQMGRLYTFYKGKNHELANFIPNNYQIDKGSVAFTDQQGKLWLFKDGEKKKVSIERVSSFELVGNTLHYDVGTSTHKVYYSGKTY